jgi:DNA-binding beta-propeller fold protein YncE
MIFPQPLCILRINRTAIKNLKCFSSHFSKRLLTRASNGQFLTKLGETGSGEGQLRGPEGVGADKESGAVYVADTGNNRIQFFEHR